MRTVDDLMDELPAKRRKAVEKMTADLIAEELTLRALRQAHKLTQDSVAQALGIKQNAVSKIEKRADLLLSTLTNYVNALGGQLHLVAEFPDRPPVALKGLGDISPEGQVKMARRSATRDRRKLSTKKRPAKSKPAGRLKA